MVIPSASLLCSSFTKKIDIIHYLKHIICLQIYVHMV